MSAFTKDEAMVRERIIFTLTLYPRLSQSMLQTGLGPHTKPQVWRPILIKMIEAGDVIHYEQTLVTPHGQFRNYRTLKLAEHLSMSIEQLCARYQQMSAGPIAESTIALTAQLPRGQEFVSAPAPAESEPEAAPEAEPGSPVEIIGEAQEQTSDELPPAEPLAFLPLDVPRRRMVVPDFLGD